MLQHFQRNFELYWDPARYLGADEQTIGFQGIHRDKLWTKFKYSGGDFQTDAVFDRGYTYSYLTQTLYFCDQ